MPQSIIQVDSFTDTPFAGNPAGVCLLERPASEAWMQSVAAEMNLAETAFIVPRASGDGFDLRWFTPAVEVALCGHATLASAKVMWEDGHVPASERIVFHTRQSGQLVCKKRGELIELDFPATPATPTTPTAAPAGLAEALGCSIVAFGRNDYDMLVEVADEETVRALTPDQRALKQLGVRGVMVTAASTSGEYDFVSRFFAPGAGIDEDPVTGSAHCTLGPWWSAKLGKTKLVGYQASQRGGVVHVEHRGERVLLAGPAVIVLRGELTEAVGTG
jgi:PhzF family phenazine biosynthesis protein